MLYEDCLKLSHTRVSEQQCCMAHIKLARSQSSGLKNGWVTVVARFSNWVRFYVVRTEISLALPCRVHRHSLFSAVTVYLMRHTAVQSSVAEGFCLNRQRCLQSQLKWLTRRPALKIHQLLQLLSASRIPTCFGATSASRTTCDEWSIAFGHHGLDVAHVHVSTSVSSRDWGPVAMTLPNSLASDCSYMLQMDGCAFRLRHPAGIGELWP